MNKTQQTAGTILVQLSPDELANVIRSNVRAVISESFPETTKKGKSTTPLPQPTDPLYTMAEVCDMLDATRKTLREWEKRGLIQPVRIARRVYYRRSDIDRALKGGQS